MRIISGSLGGRRINPPSKMPYTRPTTDIAKEGLFNILQTRIDFDSAKTLDLFGGTGSISYELASRGAAKLTLVEKDPSMYEFIKKNIERFGIKQCHVVKMDVFKFIEQFYSLTNKTSSYETKIFTFPISYCCFFEGILAGKPRFCNNGPGQCKF